MSTLPMPAGSQGGYQSLGAELPTRYPSGVPRFVEIPDFPAWGLLARAARERPERVACRFLNHELTFAEVEVAARRLADWLQHRGVACGDRVGLLLANSPEYLIGLNGIWRAGAVAVAISPLSVAAEVAALLKLTDCRTVICLDVLSGLLSSSPCVEQVVLTSLVDYLPSWKRVGYWAARWQRVGSLRPLHHRRQTWFQEAISDKSTLPLRAAPAALADDKPLESPHFDQQTPAYILSTGGTTGNPKAVTLSHRNIVANAWQQMHWAGATLGEEKMLAVLPFFHSYGMSTMLAGGAALAATLVMQPRFHPRRAIQAIVRERPTVFHAVPAMLVAMNEVLRKRPADLSSLKWVISGGASLPVPVAQEFAMHTGAMVVEGYGLSEASPVTHVGPLDGTNLLGSIGLPLPNTESRVVDLETGTQPIPDGQVGELMVRGPQVMLGYWQNPRATAEVLRDGWLLTGDMACRDQWGFYRLVDRKKDLIITAGFNVYPADVEEVLKTHPDIAEVAVIGVPDPERGERVKACVVLRRGVVWDPARLDKFCQQNLSAHRRPREWEVLSQGLPRNFLGKVVRRELRPSASSELYKESRR